MRLAWAMLLPFTLAASPAAGASTLRVGSGGPFASIGAALAAAQAGDEIRVSAGTYREDLVVRTPVRLLAEPGAHLVGSGGTDTVSIFAGGVELRGFEISGSGQDMMRSQAGVRVEGARAWVVGNRLHDNLFGIYLHGCEDARVEDNAITGFAELPVGSRGPGVHLYDSRRAQIRRNRVRHVRDGVYFDHSDENLVEDNDFGQLRYGIHYMFCKDNRFLRNALHDSVGGAAIMYTERVTFSDNHLYRNRDGYNAFGLLLKDCKDSLAERNAIVENLTGIFLDGAHRNRFERNLVAFNQVGVKLFASSLGNRFTRNDFVGNRAVLHRVGRARADWAPGGVGNYYDRYRGYDLDGDGFGDLPHPLQDPFEHLEGNQPLLRLLLHSVAAEALASAESAFPVIPRGDEQDGAPSMRPCSGTRVALPASPRDRSPWMALGSLLLVGVSGWGTWRLRR